MACIDSRWTLDRNGMRVIIPAALAHYCPTVVFELPPGLDDADNVDSLKTAAYIVKLHNAEWERKRTTPVHPVQAALDHANAQPGEFWQRLAGSLRKALTM